MKKFTNFLQKSKQKINREYLVYTGIFLGLMLAIYLYMMFAGMASSPEFTYAEF